MDEEGAAVFFFTAAFAGFFAAAALVWRPGPSKVSCGRAALPGRTGSPELACRRTRPLPIAGVGPAVSASSSDDSPVTSSTRGASVPALLAPPAAAAHRASSSSSAVVAALSSTPTVLPAFLASYASLALVAM